VSPVKYELGSYIPEDDILHSHRREHLRSYNGRLTGLAVKFKELMTATFQLAKSANIL
jgi:hypothetical protein